ncbi:hypothetical protein HOV72_015885 [Bacillus albus]|uniref:hypothetical protein n=1 Tax=Bacillus albus TaxID=2026189 RepID=UPI000B4B99D0|nr:hypothetical protein [Bacillus albus]MDC6157379.1 hypothetical protein [Bacillus albus]MDD8006856.1 hypothetical protein [Bacillus albus]
MYAFYDMYDPRPQQTSVHHWGQAETVFNINQFKGQYARINVSGLGWVIAQVLDFNPGTQQVDLNVFIQGRPNYMKIHRRDLTGIVPLGFQPPPELFGSGYPGQGTYSGWGTQHSHRLY